MSIARGRERISTSSAKVIYSLFPYLHFTPTFDSVVLDYYSLIHAVEIFNLAPQWIPIIKEIANNVINDDKNFKSL